MNIVKRNNNRIIRALQKQNDCRHEWGKYGFGYRCQKCGYYSGLNTELNDAIKILNEATVTAEAGPDLSD
jgi:hypothetical protein